MSGTELSRLLAEVTEAPPVDVDFAGVVQSVRRRQSRMRAAAGSAAVLAVGVIIAVPAVWGLSSRGSAQPSLLPPATATAVAPDSSWGHDHWNTVAWRTPPGWLPSAAYPDHSRPSNAVIDGPYIGTARLPQTSPTPRAVQGSGVLGSAGPTLPTNAVVGWFTYGQRGDSLSNGSGFSALPPYLKSQCTAMGAPYLFHAARQFGTATHGSNLSLDGCINAADPASFTAQLYAILASATDSAYPPAPTLGSATPASSTAAPATTRLHDSPGLVAASSGPYHWQMPSTWRLGLEPAATGGVLTAPRYLGPATFVDPCTLDRGGCNAPSLKVPPAGVLASIVYGPLGATAPSDPNAGSIVTNDEDCIKRGAAKAFVAERDFGTVAHGVRFVLAGCLGEGYSDATISTLKAIVASVTDDDLPPMAAPVTPTAIASGTTAAALCQSALGSYESAELTTVGDVRTASWGPEVSDGKGGVIGRLPDAFPGAKASDAAAWCWVRSESSDAAYAVHSGSRPLSAGTEGYIGPVPSLVPSGPPEFP